MSLFKKPKKPVQLRLFTSEAMEVDENEKADEEAKLKKKDKKSKDKDKSSKPSKSSLLSFGDEGLFLVLVVFPMTSPAALIK